MGGGGGACSFATLPVKSLRHHGSFLRARLPPRPALGLWRETTPSPKGCTAGDNLGNRRQCREAPLSSTFSSSSFLLLLLYVHRSRLKILAQRERYRYRSSLVLARRNKKKKSDGYVLYRRPGRDPGYYQVHTCVRTTVKSHVSVVMI